MANIYLHGQLGRKFGKEWKDMAVSSVAEAIRAVDINLKGELRKYWSQKGREKKYKVKIGDYTVTDDKELIANSGKGDIHIVPIIKGASSGWGKIFAAVAIVALAWWNPMGWSMLAANGSLTMWGSAVVGLTTSLALGGIVQLLTPVPNFNQNAGNAGNSDDAATRGSAFAGNTVGTVQGGSVPLVYGRMLVSPMPISMSLTNKTTNSTKNSTLGGVGVVSSPGGGEQYVPMNQFQSWDGYPPYWPPSVEGDSYGEGPYEPYAPHEGYPHKGDPNDGGGG
jgi:predicted phage tail protein